MKMVKVTSSNIDTVGYDNDTRQLQVTFKSGDTYRYQDVPVSTFASLLTAKSRGSFFAKNVAKKFTPMKVSKT